MSLITLLALGLHKWIREDLRAKTLSSFEDEGSQFGRMAFSIWDFNSTSKEEAEDLKYFNGEQLSLLLAEDELAIRKAQRSVAVRAKLWARRLSGILMSVILQAAVSTLIVQLTITSGQLEDTIRSSSMLQGLSPVASSIVPATVSVLNAMQPPIITAISKFEQWDSAGTYIKWMVWRLFISKFLNVMLQVCEGTRQTLCPCGCGGMHAHSPVICPRLAPVRPNGVCVSKKSHSKACIAAVL